MGISVKKMNGVGGLASVGRCCGCISDLRAGSYLRDHLVQPLKGTIMAAREGKHLAQYRRRVWGREGISGRAPGAGKGS